MGGRSNLLCWLACADIAGTGRPHPGPLSLHSEAWRGICCRPIYGSSATHPPLHCRLSIVVMARNKSGNEPNSSGLLDGISNLCGLLAFSVPCAFTETRLRVEL